jgi:hydrogenase expression/formation protein HypE
MSDRDAVPRALEAHSQRARVRDTTITLAHGGGGRAMRALIEDIFVGAFGNPLLAPLEDQALVPLADLLGRGDRLAFATDSYVVDPLFFPGGDIGSLAVNGTVNDLAMGGAVPLFLSCGFVLEEGLPVETLRRIAASMRAAAAVARVQIVTGDTKVVERGAADKVFVNTAGIGVVPRGVMLSAAAARPGDVVVVNGTLGDHGATILVARGQLALQSDMLSDCQPLGDLVATMLATGTGVRCLRDATRGGVATVLHEFARSSRVGIHLDETALPLRDEVRGACEILGLDPLYLANEGKLVAVVAAADASTLVAAMREHPAGRDAAVVGHISETPRETVVLHTGFGGERIIDLLVGEQLPRIC